jgi:hypothetical protein
MEKVAQFFFYASPSAKVFRDANAQLVISESAQLPISEQQIFSFFKKSIACHELVFGPNPYLKAASLLILQSPSNFDELTQKKTFSTGENYTGGIALFGPDRKDVYGKLGHPSYEDFLLGGLHHELGHAYTSAGPAKFKSILYASSGCTREERQMIGENLNGYFNGAIRACFDDQYEFSLEKFFGLFTSRLAEGKRNFSTDLLLFDLGLRRFGASLYWVFKAVIEQKRKHPSPFSSADILLRSAESIIGEALPGEVCDFLLAPAPASYQEYLRSGLKAQGWSLDSLPRDRASAINFILPGFSVH